MREHDATGNAGLVEPARAPSDVVAAPARLIVLQRSVGNRAVNRILARAGYSDAIKAQKWDDAAKYLNGFSAEDIDKRLADLTLGELTAVMVGAREWVRKDYGNENWDPTTSGRIRDLVYAHRNKRKFVKFTPAGKVAEGQLGSVIKWSNDAGMRIELYFLPDPAKVKTAAIAFIQVVRRVNPDGTPDRTDEQAYAADRTTRNGWHVDAYEQDWTGWYGFDKVSPRPIALPWYKTVPNIPAFMRDTPGISRDGRFEAEAAPVAHAGDDVGKAYGSITWGMTRTRGKVTTHEVGYKPTPSADFKAATAAWNAQVADPGKKAHPEQRALPAIT